MEPNDPLEFPSSYLQDLQSRVFVQDWSIPYKEDEALARCMHATIRLVEAGTADSDESCRQFVEHVMPECFRKLCASFPVSSWTQDVQEGVKHMALIFVDVCTAYFRVGLAPDSVLSILSIILDPECEFHVRNRNARYEEPSEITDPSLEFGWLQEIINKLANTGCTQLMVQLFLRDELSGPAMAAILQPLSKPAQLYRPDSMKRLLDPCVHKALDFVNGLTDVDLRTKNISYLPELVNALRQLSAFLWPDQLQDFTGTSMKVILRLLRSSHFAARTCGFKEIIQLIEESASTKQTRVGIARSYLVTWFTENSVLLLVLENNIEQSHYNDKLKLVIEFVASTLSETDLERIWAMQDRQNCTTADNVHHCVAAAACHFSEPLLRLLLQLVETSWQRHCSEEAKKRLMTFLGKMGRDLIAESAPVDNPLLTLELIWRLVKTPHISRHLVEHSLEQLLAILAALNSIHKHKAKKKFADACVFDITSGTLVLSSLRFLKWILCGTSMTRSAPNTKQDKNFLDEFKASVKLVSLATKSLSECHKRSVEAYIACRKADRHAALFTKHSPPTPLKMLKDTTPLETSTLLDNLYTHEEYILEHLNFLEFALNQCNEYLSLQEAVQIWKTLSKENMNSCISDQEMCFDFFVRCMSDLDEETRLKLFEQKLMQIDPCSIGQKAFLCFKAFFEAVNRDAKNLRKNAFTVEKPVLIGADYLWMLVLNNEVDEIAELSIDFILDICYRQLSPVLKKDPVKLHTQFAQQCYVRLQQVADSCNDPQLVVAISSAAAGGAGDSAAPDRFPMPSSNQAICRLLHLVERYISSIESTHNSVRVRAPHGASCFGYPISLRCTTDGTNFQLLRCHSNATILATKKKVNQLLGTSAQTTLCYLNGEVLLSTADDTRRLCDVPQLMETEDCCVYVKVQGGSSRDKEAAGGSSSPVGYSSHLKPSAAFSPSNYSEQEKELPSVVIASNIAVFNMLYQLVAALDSPKIVRQVQTLLDLMPSDPQVIAALDSIRSGTKVDPMVPASTQRKLAFDGPARPSVVLPLQRQLSQPISQKEVLHKLFGFTGQPFKLLYNLQVLSAKLMPVNQDNFSQAFCEAFVRAGGVGMVLSVLHQDAFSAEIDYNIQRGCYFSALQVLRFLSCGKSVLDSAIQPPADTNQPTDPCRTPLASPAKWPSQASSGKKTTVDFMLPSSSKTGLTPRKVDLQLLILQMTVEELHTLLDAIIRVAWASAVGCLSAVNNNLPPKGGYISETRRQAQGRVDSGSSAGSNGSNDIDMQSLSAKLVDNGFQRLDSLLAIEALEFLVECLEQRKMHGLSYFKALPCVDSFIIDLLVNATSTSVRKTASQGFYHLSQLQQDSASFFLQVLLKSRLPFWVTSSRARGPSRQVLSQCLEYFDLVYRLLCDTKANHTQYDVDTGQMLLEEINWLQAFTTTKSLEETDGQLMAGHFSLIKALLLCNEEKKSTLDINLIEHLLEQYLFPASSFINKKTTRVPFESFQPKCTTNESRRAAYQILVELSRGCLTNMMHITHWLLKRHHRLNNELAKEFEYEPLISGRSSSGLVGLKNAGATCYMNAVLQQMFMQPQLREAVLSVECEKNVDLDTILHQLQNVFAHLNDSQLEYYIPEQFWNSFRLWGTPVNVREQHDAFEFFTHLVDQVDEYLEKKLSTDALFKPFYEGIFSDQKICQGCPHRYVRDESFMALNLPVKSQSLVESLEQFVKGELLSGDNAYFCERCGHKRDTVKRLCIKKLPPVLTIQLKRFGFDFEANRAVKFDYYFKFPWVLDMAPYTVEYLDKKEMGSGRGGELFDANCYQLVGAVVHSGQANAGHYYSFIKDRREKHDPNTWFKFNDTTVEKIDLTDATLEIECFGGNYKAKVSDTSSFYPEDRVRHWNAYMLFYERKDLFLRNPTSTKTPKSGKNRFSFYIEKEKPLHVASKSACLASAKADSLSQLTTLVDHGERRGLFPSRVPPHIQQQVHEENLEFMHNKEIYNKDYMKFILQLCSINAECVQASDKDFEQLMVESIKLGTHFLLNTYLKYKHKDSGFIEEWIAVLEKLLLLSPSAALWLLRFFAQQGASLLKLYLLDCPLRNIRAFFGQILNKCLQATKSSEVETVIDKLLVLLDKEVEESCRQCNEYLTVLSSYAQMGTLSCQQMLRLQAYKRLVVFLLGERACEFENDEQVPRRWSASQAAELIFLHRTLASLIQACDLSPLYSHPPEIDHVIPVSVEQPLPLPDDVRHSLTAPGVFRLIHELVCACAESSLTHARALFSVLAQLSFCNRELSRVIIRQAMVLFANLPSNELRNLSQLLMKLLQVQDGLRAERVELIINGALPPDHDGILAIVAASQDNDSRRAYQGIKFLVTLATKTETAKEYLLKSVQSWQWAVEWLQNQMERLVSSSDGQAKDDGGVEMSNEDSNTKTFQRTVSAQDTLAEATALLSELSSPETGEVPMETDG
ncbi:ubiquitin carboxyl-terminal hydrolase 24-like isoform X2 [Varroa destructor]|nr:ubiquitin carboxyl-terminal hydrolase 24-like isoform X2 [Varroa destructor]